MKQPDACVVRIADAEGRTLGTGFLVFASGLIATCAHVAEGTEPCVAFPGGEPCPAQVVATDPTHDLVILRLEGELPPGAEPARLGRSAEGHYSDFRSRGYRPLGEMQGIPAEGRVLHAVSECPGVRYLPLILKSQDIRRGMSGAPVYVPDLDLAVGMITDYWDSLKAGTGFADRDTALATPSEAIVALAASEGLAVHYTDAVVPRENVDTADMGRLELAMYDSSHNRLTNRLPRTIPGRPSDGARRAEEVAIRLYLHNSTRKLARFIQIEVLVKAHFLAYPYATDPVVVDDPQWRVERVSDEMFRCFFEGGADVVCHGNDCRNIGVLRVLVPHGEAEGGRIAANIQYKVRSEVHRDSGLLIVWFQEDSDNAQRVD